VQNVDDHRAAGEGSEGFAWESDRGVARWNNGEDRHAIIAGNSILGAVLRQETASHPPSGASRMLERPSAAALYALAVVLSGAAAALAVVRAHEDRMALRTGAAEWIWYSRGPREPRPVRFFATREILLSAAPARATAKLIVDREHVLYVNGARAGSATQRPGDPLRLYPIAALLHPGVNRIAIEAASPTGVGGILFSLDLDGFGRDAVVTDSLWRVDLSRDAVATGARYRPIVWGRPPQHPWGYPRLPRPNELSP
jgi:hypothetical protein